jgi:hypothetical protein
MKTNQLRSIVVPLLQGVVASLRDALRVFRELAIIIVPIGIVTRILEQLGLINVFGDLLAPLMQLVGLPGELGLVWATAMVVNIYGGMMVFATVAPGLELTVAQVTVLGTMVLIAHSLPVELRVAQKVGTRLRAMLLLRVLSAFALGFILERIYLFSGTLQQPNQALWTPAETGSDWGAWGLAQLENLLLIFLIIFTLIMLLALLKRVGVTELLTRLLQPLLALLGLGREAAPLAIIGMTLGISYGGGLLIREVESGKLSRKDVFISLALMGLCHSIIEDTLVVMVLGAHLSGILWGRLIFTLVVVFVLARLITLVPQSFFERHLVRPIASGAGAQGHDESATC